MDGRSTEPFLWLIERSHLPDAKAIHSIQLKLNKFVAKNTGKQIRGFSTSANWRPNWLYQRWFCSRTHLEANREHINPLLMFWHCLRCDLTFRELSLHFEKGILFSCIWNANSSDNTSSFRNWVITPNTYDERSYKCCSRIENLTYLDVCPKMCGRDLILDLKTLNTALWKAVSYNSTHVLHSLNVFMICEGNLVVSWRLRELNRVNISKPSWIFVWTHCSFISGVKNQLSS